MALPAGQGGHARASIKLPSAEGQTTGQGRKGPRPTSSAAVVATTVGRVLFNDILKASMSYYNITLKSEDLARTSSSTATWSSDGATTIELLDRMKQLGFREVDPVRDSPFGVERPRHGSGQDED